MTAQEMQLTSATTCKPVVMGRSSATPARTLEAVSNKNARPLAQWKSWRGGRCDVVSGVRGVATVGQGLQTHFAHEVLHPGQVCLASPAAVARAVQVFQEEATHGRAGPLAKGPWK